MDWQEEHKKRMEELERTLEENRLSKISDLDKEIIELVPFYRLPVLNNEKSNSYNIYLTAFATDLKNLIGNEYPSKQIGEIAFSYFQNKASILDAYSILASYSFYIKDEFKDNGILKINNCSILLKDIVVSIKTAVDSICVFLQLLENEDVSYHQYTDINKYCGTRNGIMKGKNQRLIDKVEEIKNANWFNEVSEIRNKVIHRGFTLESWLQREFEPGQEEIKMVQHRFCLPRHVDSEKNHSEFESYDSRCHFRKLNLNPIMEGFLKLEQFEKELIEILISEDLSKGVTEPRAGWADCARNIKL